MGTIITVSSAAELRDALNSAKGGEVIKLAGGDYGNLSTGAYTGTNGTFPSNVTITSADPLHPASFSGLSLSKASNLTLDGVVFDYKFAPGDQIYKAPFTVGGGDHVAIRNCTFDGDVASGISTEADGFGSGYGLTVRGTTNVAIENNEIFNFYKGMVITECSDVSVKGNDLHSMRMDGMDYSQVQNINIEGNHIHDFRGSPTSADHCDMIQFWTVGNTVATSNVTIQGNLLDIGDGTFTQSIFMGNSLIDKGLAGPEMYFQNVKILQNVIVNGQVHGIAVGASNGLVIANNTVLHADGDTPDGADAPVEIPRIDLSPLSTGVTITGNVTSEVAGYTNQPSWVVSRNVLVQDQNPGGDGFYGDVFISSTLTSHDGVHAFLALPGSLIDVLGAGAAATRDRLADPGTVAALFQAGEDSSGAVQTRLFDASLSMTDVGSLPVGTVYQWTFGDGTIATGARVTHNYATGGHYDVSLTIRLPNGATDTVHGTVGVQDTNILTLGSDGAFRAHEYESTILLPTGKFGTTAGIQLGAAGVSVAVSNDHVADVLRAENFDISMRLDADSRTSSGEIFRLNSGMIASVTTKGEVYIHATSAAGTVLNLTSTGKTITDLRAHAIDVRLHDGDLQLWIDGKMAAHGAFDGPLQSSPYFNLSFGNPWGQKNFYGDLTAFDIKVGETALALDKNILSLDAHGQFQTAQTAQASAAAASIAGPSDDGLHLGAVGVVASVDGTSLTDLVTAQDFNIALQIHSEAAETKGNVFHMDNSLLARVNGAGEFVVFAANDDGTITRVATTGAHMADGTVHDFDIRLNAGNLQLWMDGTLASQAAFTGTLHDNAGGNLMFGNVAPYTNFQSDLTAFDVTVAGSYTDSAWTNTVA